MRCLFALSSNCSLYVGNFRINKIYIIQVSTEPAAGLTGNAPVAPATTKAKDVELITGTTDAPAATTSKAASDATTDSVTPVASESAFANLFFLLIIFGVVIAAFVWVGGMRYVSRFLPDSMQARYSKLDSDDLVK